MSRWPHDDPASLAAFYGAPGPEVERHLVHVVPPFQMFYDDGKKPTPLKSLLFHSKAADALMVALNRVWEKCGKDQATVDRLRISRTAGAYCHRKISGSDRWSNHAFGGAIDIDSAHNGFHTGRGTQPTLLTEAFDSVGFRWGGRYRGRTDPMHYEACDDGTPHPAGLLDIPETAGVEFEPWSGEAHVMGLLLDPAAGGEDEHEDESAERGGAAPSASGFFGRARNWIVAAASSAGFTGLGALTDWQIAAVLLGFVFVSVACITAFIIIFFGAEPVRDWVRRHVA